MPILRNEKRTIIVFATSYLPFLGGAQVAVDEITRRLPDCKVVLFTSRLSRELATRENINQVEVHRLGFGFMGDRFLLPLLGPLAALRRPGQVGVIWAMMANFGGMAALIYHKATLRRNPLILTLQEGGDFQAMEKKAGLLLPFMRMVVRNSDFLQSISHSLLDWGRSLGFKSNRYTVIPNGVDLEIFHSRNSLSECSLLPASALREGTKLLFTASRLSQKNGIADVIRALAALPKHYHFAIAGTGPLESNLRELSIGLELSTRVHFLGSLSQKQVAECLRASHIFIRPSLSEGLGNAFLEAMAAGVPIVGTMVGGIKDFLVDGVTGVAARPQDPASIAAAVLRYENPQFYENVRTAGASLVRSEYSWDYVATRWHAMLNNASVYVANGRASVPSQSEEALK